MAKKSVKMAAAVISLAAICGIYGGVRWLNAREEEQVALEEEEEEKTWDVFSASKDDIQSLNFLIDKTEVTFQKEEDDTWVKEDEKSFPVDQDHISEMLYSIENITASRILEDVENLEEYDLDSPVNTIHIQTSDSETILRVGMKNDLSDDYYVKLNEDDSTVYLVDSDIIDLFMGSLYDYARMESFPSIGSADIKSVSFSGEEEFTLYADEDTTLWHVDDKTEKADSAKVSSLMTSISNLSYHSFVDYDCDDLAEYGLETPYLDLTVVYEEEIESPEGGDESGNAATDSTTQTVEKQIVLHIGNASDDLCRYVRLDDSNQIYTISEESLSNILDKSPADFWNMTVSYISVNDLEKLSIQYNGETTEVDVSRETSEDEDGNETETIVYSLNGEKMTDSIPFTTFYNKVVNLTAEKRNLENDISSSQAEMILTFQKTNGDVIQISYYAYDNNYYAAVIDEKVYLVNKMNLKDLFSAYEELTVD